MNITNQVTNILRASRAARNSDKELYLIYMQKFGLNLTDEQIDTFRRMPSLESIRRVRQKIQEGGDLVADDKIKKERLHKAMVMQQASPVYKPEQIEKTLRFPLPWGKG